MCHPSSLLVALIAFSAMPAVAHAQIVYRCNEDGRVTYSNRPCDVGAMRTLLLRPEPPLEDQLRANARLRQAVSEFNERNPVHTTDDARQSEGLAMGSSRGRATSDANNVAWCETARADAGALAIASAGANLLVSVPRRR